MLACLCAHHVNLVVLLIIINLKKSVGSPKLLFDRKRAAYCIDSDYLSYESRFDDKQFVFMFRITKSMVELLLKTLRKYNSFFRTTCDCTGQKSVKPIIKLLSALKYLAFGISYHAFMDYFQTSKYINTKLL